MEKEWDINSVNNREWVVVGIITMKFTLDNDMLLTHSSS